MRRAKTPRGDPMLWAARRLYRALERRGHDRDGRLAGTVQALLDQQANLARHWRRACKATAKGWASAAALERESLIGLAQSMRYYLAEVCNQGHAENAGLPQALTVQGILDELRQLREEFEQVVVEPRRGMVGVVTKPVTLEGIDLGPFRLELYPDRLAERHDVSVVDCVALDPNPASTSDDTTHPHVRDNLLCAGDATMPVQSALRDGRVCDALLLINAVLHTYNGSSAYVPLDEWRGISCGDCGYSQDAESMYRCAHCEAEVCENCVGTCDECDASYCQACLERAQDGEGQHLCPGCRTTCPLCGDVAPASDVRELGVCRICREEQEEEQRQRELEREEQDHHEHDHNSDETVNATPTSTTPSEKDPADDAVAADVSAA